VAQALILASVRASSIAISRWIDRVKLGYSDADRAKLALKGIRGKPLKCLPIGYGKDQTATGPQALVQTANKPLNYWRVGLPVTYMSLQLSDLHDLQNGKRDHVLVGLLPEGIPTQLGIRIHEVFLSASSLAHIQKKHPDTTLYDLLRTPLAIKRGLLIRLEQKPSHVVICFEDEDSETRYCGTIKILKSGAEMYLLTYYRTHNRFTASLIRRGTIVKTHD
jgi:hypothetical protein